MRQIATLGLVALVVGIGVVAAQETATTPTAGQAEEILNRMLEALGGEKFLGVKDITRRGRMYSFNRGELSSPGERFVDYFKLPSKERLELGKDGKIVYLNNNDQGWELDRQGVREMTPEQIENFQESNRRDYESLLRFRARGEKMQVYYLGREFADNRRVHVLELVDERGESNKLLVDARTYLPVQLHYRERDLLSGDWVQITEYFGKFIDVQGIQTPKQFTRERAGLRSLEVHFSEVQYNTGLSDDLFTRPSLEAHWQKVK
jgi:outer membrane lipoprotein-sorting protein